ncbi:MAG TPA: hydrogenase maturation protease [Candidatus Omnitrophica bacterium]|nr:MAG: hypothetical protein A2105_03550 [Omnitrophica WOR_2 bacterium GWF2_63_9]HAM41362.1 hydrogenase maturation protease [Candidatus Omnitrophota bacterium]HBH96314.1 hydrogenase maturation protease [Candidatus Omnitrophota bacterium]HBQ37579.1 hydrogenase maturation protease [Candidatus Omnitrophota bacterium]
MNVLVIGIGNLDRGDDAAGRLVARALKDRVDGRVSVRESDGNGGSLMDVWRGARTVFLVDATSCSAAPGTVVRVEAHAQPLPSLGVCTSTHGVGVAEAVEMARALGRLPRKLIIYGIEGRRCDPGAALSPAVEEAVPRVAQWIAEEIRTMLHDLRKPALHRKSPVEKQGLAL